ncbi:spermatogenesis-associated protein 7 [Silurus meridionalis]|nr:spermatogenesis-associated protein 7 [Silurus meridionalis]
MISHYKKLYSAKAVVDCSIPKSMRSNVKYLDQKRHEQLKKERTQSARSLSKRSLRLDNISSCSPRNARPSAHGAESPYINSGVSVMSSPRFSTSFHCKQIVYSSQMAAQSQNCRASSELCSRSPKSQSNCFTLSCATSSSQEKFKSFQDPSQKTYSGDLLLKHAHCFTQEKPYKPRTLKKDTKSTLSTYRYYTPANRKQAKEKTPTKSNQPGPHLSSADREWSDEESNVFGQHGTENNFRAKDFFLSSSRVSPEGMRSPFMRKVTAEEEELLYLQFISDVTDEIVQRGFYSDRVLERVFERHVDMNKHRLAEDKMRHLLEVLHNDLQKPSSSSVTVLENKEGYGSLSHKHKDSSLQQELGNSVKDTSILSSTPLRDKDTWELGGVTSSSLDTTPVHDSISLTAISVRQEDKKCIMDLERDHKKRNAASPGLKKYQFNEGDRHHGCAENKGLDEVDELGRNMAESLKVSEIHNSQEVMEQNSFVKLSDDEF